MARVDRVADGLADEVAPIAQHASPWRSSRSRRAAAVAAARRARGRPRSGRPSRRARGRRSPTRRPARRSSSSGRSAHWPVNSVTGRGRRSSPFYESRSKYIVQMHKPRRALRHDVRDGIVRSILEGENGPGDRLIEMHIAREYGTSQGPVREALRELEMLGFVRSVTHRGTYVRDPWQRGMLELYEVRGALEEFAARLATPRAVRGRHGAAGRGRRDGGRGRAQRRPRRRRAQRGLPPADRRGHRQPAARDDVEQPRDHRPHGADDGHADLDMGVWPSRTSRSSTRSPPGTSSSPARSAVVTRRVSSRCSPRRWTARRWPPRSVTSATPRAPRRRRRRARSRRRPRRGRGSR